MNATRKLAALAAAAGALATASAYAQTLDPLPLPKALQAPPSPRRGLPPVAMPVVGSSQPADPKDAVTQLLRDARLALRAGDRQQATRLVARASALNVPETRFGPGEDTPSALALELRRRIDPAVNNAAAVIAPGADNGVRPAIHYPTTDQTSARPAAALAPAGGPRLAQLPSPFEAVTPPPAASPAVLLAEGEQSLREGNLDAALTKFRQANASRAGLDAGARRRLDDHLRMLTSTSESVSPPPGRIDASIIDEADQGQQVLARQLVAAVGRAQVEARELRESNPRKALEMLLQTRGDVEGSGVPSEYRSQLTRRLDITIGDTKRFIENNRAQIELDERNAAILADIDRENVANQKKREKIAELIDQFNDKLDQDSYLEADLIAKRLWELAPDDPVVKQVMVFSKLARRSAINDENNARKEELNWTLLENIESTAGRPGGTDDDEIYYDRETWDSLQGRESLGAGRGRLNAREKDIEQRLRTPVQVNFEDRPLKEVMDSLTRMTGVDIYLDPRGLSDEGVTTDTPVSLEVQGEISLRSALNLILSQVNLAYTIRDEVLQVTSQELRNGDIYTDVYYVADLVIPIPNFVPSNNIGLQGLINDALAVTGYGGRGIGGPGALSFVNGTAPGAENPEVLAQIPPSGQLGASPQQLTTGPGGLGGAASADFDSLIDLITSTVSADTWAANGGGEAEVTAFPTNLSLVVSQTQSVHEEIADLLDQLRRLQDLQVTIEVRFIRLNDDFFERIGIDFDLNINDRILGTDQLVQTTAGGAFRPNEFVAGGAQQTSSSATVGVQAPVVGDLATVTADLDLPFRQGSFPVAQPTFGGFNPGSAATFGFAILSDIEAFFLINAAQGDSRTNVLNAPKVTLFNGQQAFVSDASQTPFVISVVPVVGEFAAAQQPVIVVLNEGTMMSIQAVVSEDRRYVRLTVVPFFSEIGDVDTFQFDGSTTTDASSSTSATDADDDGTSELANNAATNQVINAGTTVQLPTFQFVSVTTTVSVPDGGTVLLGGIKRLNEGRTEFGVPLLSKLPYINRLFRNVGIGRETDSLMMMVTPRIIIQEEEEERLGLLTP